jgi:hypothetical protein
MKTGTNKNPKIYYIWAPSKSVNGAWIYCGVASFKDVKILRKKGHRCCPFL